METFKQAQARYAELEREWEAAKAKRLFADVSRLREAMDALSAEWGGL